MSKNFISVSFFQTSSLIALIAGKLISIGLSGGVQPDDDVDVVMTNLNRNRDLIKLLNREGSELRRKGTTVFIASYNCV